MTLFLDMDGVLADFDAHHEAVFGRRSCKVADNVDWKAVRAVGDFYLNIPPMGDARVLWDAVKHLKPVVLTGVPLTKSVPEAPENKRAWVHKHLGPDIRVITTLAREKFLYAKNEDGSPNILVDDWEKHKSKWVDAGGIWITHVSATDTIYQLKKRKIL